MKLLLKLSTILSGAILFSLFCLRKRIFNSTLQRQITQLRLKIEQSIKKKDGIVPLKFDYLQRIERVNRLPISLLLVKGIDAKICHTQTIKVDPFIPPFQQGKLICELGSTHYLLKNKFPVNQKHFLLVTKSLQKQWDPLNRQDLRYSYLVMKSFHGMVFYNNGKQSGFTQQHKHIQICKIGNQMVVIPLIQSQIKQQQFHKVLTFSSFNFRHGIIRLHEFDFSQNFFDNLYQDYNLIKKTKACQCYSSNLLMTQKFIIIIPRKKQKIFDRYPVNSLIFTGSMGVRTQENLNQIRKYQLQQMLQNITLN